MVEASWRKISVGLLVLGFPLLLAFNEGVALSEEPTSIESKAAYERAKEALEDAVYFFETGRFEAASGALNSIGEIELSPRDCVRLRLEPDFSRVGDMVGKEETSAAASGLLKKIASGADVARSDPEYLSELVSNLRAGVTEKRWATSELRQAGARAVGFLIERLLAAQSPDEKAPYILALVAVGSDSVLPVSEMLKDNRELVQRTAIRILRMIGDEQALPFLQSVAQAKGVSASVRNDARLALRDVAGRKLKEVPAADILYRRLAEKYLRMEPPARLPLYGDSQPIWTWSSRENSLEREDLPSGIYGARVAQRLCLMGLSFNPENWRLWVVLSKAYFAEEAALALMQEGKPERPSGLGIAAGTKAALQALDEVLKEKEILPALAALKALSFQASAGGLPGRTEKELSSVLRGLDSSDARVRLSSAEVLAYSALDRRTLLSSPTLSILTGAFRKAGEAPLVLLACPRGKRRTALAAALRATGMKPIEVSSLKETFKRARAIPSSDIIVVSPQREGFTEEVKEAFRFKSTEWLLGALKENDRTRHISLILLARENRLRDLRERFPDVTVLEEGLTASDVASAAKNILGRSLKPDPLNGQKRWMRAADALEAFSLSGETPGLSVLLPELMDVVSGEYPPEAKLKALTILQRIAAVEAIPALSAMLSDEGLDGRVAVKGYEVLSATFARRGISPSMDVLRLIRRDIISKETPIREAAIRLFACIPLTGRERLEMIRLIDEDNARATAPGK